MFIQCFCLKSTRHISRWITINFRWAALRFRWPLIIFWLVIHIKLPLYKLSLAMWGANIGRLLNFSKLELNLVQTDIFVLNFQIDTLDIHLFVFRLLYTRQIIFIMLLFSFLCFRFPFVLLRIRFLLLLYGTSLSGLLFLSWCNSVRLGLDSLSLSCYDRSFLSFDDL